MSYAHYNVDETPLTTLVDTSGGTVIYLGQSLPGTATSALLWRIQKIDTSSGVQMTYANGSPTFQVAWDSRLTYAYT
jgi:hypothetical protein